MAEQKYTAEYDPVDGEQHDWVVTNGDGFFVRTDEWNAAEIAQAMNVVAQLPKDATGKPVLPGSRVYWAFANGMSLLDWFAGQALAGILAAEDDNREFGVGGTGELAARSYRVADAMLAERARRDSAARAGGEGVARA